MSSAQEGVTIRHATEEDVPTILLLIQELAAYEKEPLSTVEATEASLLATLAFAPSLTTSSTRPAKCLLLHNAKSECCGLALYFYNYSTWRSKPGVYLEDLFVKEKERGKGYGKRLLRELAREVVEMGGGRLEWSVLKWNKPSIKFYEGIGARAMEEWVGMRIDGDALGALAGRV